VCDHDLESYRLKGHDKGTCRNSKSLKLLLPLVGVPELIAAGLKSYRDLFCRAAGFDHVSRYVTGLLLSLNKTLQGIYGQQVWPEQSGVSRRAMHAAVFEAGWDSAG